MKQHKLIISYQFENQAESTILETKMFLRKKLLKKYVKQIKNGDVGFPEFGLHTLNVNQTTFDIISELIQLKCFCCNKNVDGDYKIWDTSDKTKIDKGITGGTIDKGIAEIITAGYGSIYDLSHFLLAICDDCITEKLKQQMYFLGDQFTQI